MVHHLSLDEIDVAWAVTAWHKECLEAQAETFKIAVSSVREPSQWREALRSTEIQIASCESLLQQLDQLDAKKRGQWLK